MPKENNYNDLVALKGPDQVRLRPGVIFGSDASTAAATRVRVISESIDEAREGYGKRIIITLHEDKSITVEDFGRGIPIDFNKSEDKYNWELAFCTLYAGSKYNNNSGGNYSFALGLNGLGLCATQFSSEYMEVESRRGQWNYSLRFEKGFNVTQDERGFKKSRGNGTTGTKIHWKPDLEVFTDIDIGADYLADILRRQAVVNDGVELVLKNEHEDGTFTEQIFCYENGISDYLLELGRRQVDDNSAALDPPSGQAGDREDKDEYKLKLNVAFTFSKEVQFIEHYHNSSWLEHGGSPQKALQKAFLSQIDGYLKSGNKYNKGERA